MNPMTGEQIDYGDEEYEGSQKMQFNQSGAIPALAEEEMIGDDDEYDDLYNDVNVGGGFQQMQQSEAQMPPSGIGNGGFQDSKTNVPGTTVESITSQQTNNRVANEGTYLPTRDQFTDQNAGLPASPTRVMDDSQRVKLPEMAHISKAEHLGYQGSLPVPQKTDVDQMNKPEKVIGELAAPSVNLYIGSSKSVPQAPTPMMSSRANVGGNHILDDEYVARPQVGNGNTMLFVGELHWWTTDADLESELIQYGKVKEIKFFDERASGKSKGYCQVEFYDPAAAAACKEGMHEHVFNGRACVVAFATPQTITQMGSSNRTQNQVQSQLPGRNPINDGAGRGNRTHFPSGDGGRNYGRGAWGRGGNQVPNKGPGPGLVRGRGMVNKNMLGNAPGPGGGAYGQGPAGPGFGGPPGLMHPQGMMGPGFDLAFMGRGGGYGGFSGPTYPGMLPPYPPVNSMGLPGVAPHVNPAFFARGMAPNGMGMMGNAGMDAPHSGMWGDSNVGGWGGEEHGRGTRESSYGGEDNASEYGYEEASQEKGIRSSGASREKERNTKHDESSNNPENRNRDERDYDRDRYDRDHKDREEKNRYRDHRHKSRDSGYDDDWDKGQSSRSHTRSRAMPGDDHRSRSRDADYRKRRRMPSE